MTKDEFAKLDGIDILRRSTRILSFCNETFNQQWSAEELLKIATAALLGEWDVLPDRWSEQQVRAAIEHGTAPKFEETEYGLHSLDVTDCGCSKCWVQRHTIVAIIGDESDE